MNETQRSLAVVARAPLEAADTNVQRKVLTFALDDELFGLDITDVREIIEYGSVTRVPMADPAIRGVINLRGSVVPVVDLAVRLGKASLERTKRTCIVILEAGDDTERLEIGVVVDAVNEVIDVNDDVIEAAPSFGASVREDFIAGMARLGKRFVILLEKETVLSIAELAGVVNEI